MLVTRKNPELIGTSEVVRVAHNCTPITWEVEAGELLSLAFFWSQRGIHSESQFRKENLREIQFYFKLPPKIISDYQILLPRNRFPPQAGRLAASRSLALTPSLALPQWRPSAYALSDPQTLHPYPPREKQKSLIQVQLWSLSSCANSERPNLLWPASEAID